MNRLAPESSAGWSMTVPPHLLSRLSEKRWVGTLRGSSAKPTSGLQRSSDLPTSDGTRRRFAVSASLLMILVVFAVIPGEVRAGTVQSFVQPLAPQAVTYGPSWERNVNPDGTVEMHQLPTFQRWDGVYLPWNDLNYSAGNWPYQFQETGTSLTISRLGQSFTQAKVAGASYNLRPNEIKETIRINSSFPVPVTTPALFVRFSSTYLGFVNGSSISLYDTALNRAWTTAPFAAWDSASTPHIWDNAVDSVQVAAAGFSLMLDSNITQEAVFPLYIDPTWIVGGASGWGGSTFQDATVDQGDGSVKIGWLADNFNDNTNEVWTIESGSATFANGVMSLGTNSAVHAGGSWTAQHDRSQLEFTSSLGTVTFYTEYSGRAFPYAAVVVDETNQRLQFEESTGGPPQLIGTLPVTISKNTWYTLEVVVGSPVQLYTIYWTPAGGSRTTWTPCFSGPCSFLPVGGFVRYATDSNAQTAIDNVRVWNTASGTITTPVRNAGATNRPLQVQLSGSVDAYNETHIQIQSSADGITWGAWTNVKSDTAIGTYYNTTDQDRQPYYQLLVTLTSGVSDTPVLTQISTFEGAVPTANPTAGAGTEPWYPFVAGLVNAVNGNLLYSQSDFSFLGKAFTLAIARSYNSVRGAVGGPFGNGWTFNYNQYLTVNPDGSVTWTDGSGATQTFVPKGSTAGFSPPMGITARLNKNPNGTYTMWFLDGSQERYTSTGQFTSIVDRNGNTLTFTYSTGNTILLTKVSDANGRSLSFSYGSSNTVTNVSDPSGRKYGYSYNSGNLVSATDPLGYVTTYSYSSGRLAYVVDPVGKQTLFTYDGSGRVIAVYRGLFQGGQTVWKYLEYSISYPSSTSRTIVNARGYTTTLNLTSSGAPTQVVGPPIGVPCGPAGNTTTCIWDGEMNRIKLTDGRGNSWTTAYGFRGNVLSITDPGGSVSSNYWTEANGPAQYLEEQTARGTFKGFYSNFGFDGVGNLVSITDPGGNSTQFGYDVNGFLNKTVNARGYTTWFVYNASGYLVKSVDPLNAVTQNAYDILGRQTSMTTPLGNVSKTTFDADSRVTKTTDPLGNFTTYTYDGRGGLIQATDPDGATTTHTINVTSGNDQSVRDSGGNVTTYTYDLRGNVVSVKDANLHTTNYTYDKFDRLVTTTTPLGYVTTYVYDAAGNRISRTDGNGATTRYQYDKLNRVIHTSYPGLPVYPTPQTLNYSYDRDGNLVSATGFGYTETFTYDGQDRLASSAFGFGKHTVTISYTYDRDGNKATMSLGSNVTNYFYDPVERLTGMKDPEGQNTTFGYDKDSRQTLETNPSGVTTARVYDAASRLRALYTNTSSKSLLESFSYMYDKAGLRTQETDVQGGATTTTTYAYDGLHRLYKTVQGTSTTTDTYDAVGNVATETTSSTETFTYDADNELTQASFSPTIYTSYGYDKNGNRISETVHLRGTTYYSYDYENRLISSFDGFTTCTNTYAPTGERVTHGCSATVTDLAYDRSTGGNLLATYTSTGTQSARYLDGGGLNTPAEVYEGGAHYAYQKDALGSVRMLTGGSQNATVTYAYDPWGNLVSQSGSLANPLEYTGAIYDSSNGFYDMRARFYDPSAGGGHGFLSQDPRGGGYAYAGDSPANFVDPTGKDPIPPGNPPSGTYTSAYCDGWAVVAGICIPSSNAPDAYLPSSSGGDGSGGTGTPPGPATWNGPKCTMLAGNIILGVTSTIVFGFRVDVRGLIGDTLMGTMTPLLNAWNHGDWGEVAWIIVQLAASLFLRWLATQPWWISIAQALRINAIWLSIGLAAAFLAMDVADYLASGCV